MKLDAKGRCCGRKPLKYKRDGEYFCPRCDRAYSLINGEQIENWAWIKMNSAGEFVRNPKYKRWAAMQEGAEAYARAVEKKP